MGKNNYDIDDILLEAKKLREKQVPEKKDLENTTKLDEALNLVDELTGENFTYSTVFAKIKPHQTEDIPKVLVDYDTADKIEVDLNFDNSHKKETFAPPKPEDFTPIETPPVEATPELPKKRKRWNKKATDGLGDGKVDLFNFQPEKRERPVRPNPFAQKSFDFAPPQPVSPQPTPPQKAVEKPKPIAETGPIPAKNDFDFDSISDKIDDLQEEQDSSNPFSQKNIQSEKDRIRNRYSKLIFGEQSSEEEDVKFKFNVKDTGSFPSTESGEGESPQRKSIFGTFATGTGRELKIEDIKKIDFSNLDGHDEYYEDEEIDTSFIDNIPDGKGMNISEFLPDSNRRDVSRDIADNKLSVFIRTGLVGVITFIFFYLSFATRNLNLGLPPFIVPAGATAKNFLFVSMGLGAAVLLICLNTTISGLGSLFRLRANSDTLVVFAMLGSIFQGFQAVRNIETINLREVTLFFPIASLIMLFSYIGKLGMLGRIQRNFRITAANRERCGVAAVESPGLCKDLMPHIAGSKPTIAYSVKSDFFSDFLSLSFSTKYDVGINRAVAPVCIIGAIIVSIATRFLSSSGFMAGSAFAAVLCICATLSGSFIENIPLGKMSKKLVPLGAMVSGNKAVETFCDTDSVVLTDNDLFPNGHVYLSGIKAFPNGRIDEAILDAASVLCALQGSLGYVFLDMIGGNEKLLKKVDNVVYENNMGLSGWVDGRRVLIGNRLLMQNHGVPLPNDSYEKANPIEAPDNPIYLSNSGEVSARFLVKYSIDEALAYQLDKLAYQGKELIVYTTDANIDASLIESLYGYPIDLITIMPSELQDEFREISQPREEMPAEIVFTGKPASFIAAILAAGNARSSILLGTIIQLFQIVLGYGLIALMAFMGNITTISLFQMMLYQAFWVVIIMAVQQLKKP